MGDQGGQRKVTGMENIITNKPGRAPVVHFVSGLDECEKKTVAWEVQNIAELLKMSTEEMKENGITFDAGHSIGIPATWYLYFTRAGSATGLYPFLKLDTDSKAKLVKASCSISLSCEAEIFALGDRDPKEFKNPLPAGVGGFACLLTRPSLKVSNILQKTDNGRKALKVTLTLNVFSSKESVEVPKGNLLKAEDVVSDFEKLLESGDGADVEIRVPLEVGEEVDDDDDFYIREVHKTVLMARSTVFAKMFAKESDMVEAKTGKVVIKDLSPKGLDILLHYIYSGKVLDDWLKVPEEILNASEKYDLGKLKQYCGHNLIAAATPRNAIDLYKVAKLHKLSFAKCAITEFVSKNLRAVLDDGEEPSEDEENATE